MKTVTLTEILAIVGAVSGLTGTALGLLSFIRDRARLVVRFYEGMNDVSIYVVNAGRQPVPILGVGLTQRQGRSRIGRLIRALRRPRNQTWVSWPALSIDDPPAVLTPGKMLRFELVSDEGDVRSPVPIRAYAYDFRERMTISRDALHSTASRWSRRP